MEVCSVHRYAIYRYEIYRYEIYTGKFHFGFYFNHKVWAHEVVVRKRHTGNGQ